MQIDSGTVAIVLALLSASGATACILALLKTRRALDEQKKELGQRLDALSARLSALDPDARQESPEVISIAMPGDVEESQPKDELLAAITAAAIAVADRRARSSAANSEPDGSSAWSQQGRVTVQSSHNITPRH